MVALTLDKIRSLEMEDEVKLSGMSDHEHSFSRVRAKMSDHLAQMNAAETNSHGRRHNITVSTCTSSAASDATAAARLNESVSSR